MEAPKGKGLIAIDVDVVKTLNDAKTPFENAAATMFLESTVMHEAIHFGNVEKTGKSDNPGLFDGMSIQLNYNGEVGKTWEQTVYGTDVGRQNYQLVLLINILKAVGK